MPPITRWFIKSGIFYFITGLILAFVAELPMVQPGVLLLPVYLHMLVVGWITQVIMGVSIWMFPRRRLNHKRERTLLGLLAFVTLNAGLVLRFFSKPFIPFWKNEPIVTITVVTSSILQVFAVLCFVIEIWPRLQPKKKKREK